MADMTVHRHGERWAVAERGADTPLEEFPTREAAELAARHLAAGGEVEVLEHDPTSLQHEPTDAGEDVPRGQEPGTGLRPSEDVRSPQSGL